MIGWTGPNLVMLSCVCVCVWGGGEWIGTEINRNSDCRTPSCLLRNVVWLVTIALWRHATCMSSIACQKFWYNSWHYFPWYQEWLRHTKYVCVCAVRIIIPIAKYIRYVIWLVPDTPSVNALNTHRIDLICHQIHLRLFVPFIASIIWLCSLSFFSLFSLMMQYYKCLELFTLAYVLLACS